MDFIRKRIRVFITSPEGKIIDVTTAWHVKGLGPTFRLISKVRTHEVGFTFGLCQWPKILHPQHGLVYASLINVQVFPRKNVSVRGMVVQFTLPLRGKTRMWSLQIPLELQHLWRKGIKWERLA